MRRALDTVNFVGLSTAGGGNWVKSGVDVVEIVGLGVARVVVNGGVVDAIFLTAVGFGIGGWG